MGKGINPKRHLKLMLVVIEIICLLFCMFVYSPNETTFSSRCKLNYVKMKTLKRPKGQRRRVVSRGDDEMGSQEIKKGENGG